MDMLFRSVWLSFSIFIRFVVELFGKHIFDPWLSNRLYCMEGVAGGSIGRAKAKVAPSLSLSSSPEKASHAKYYATRKYEQSVEHKIATQQIQRKIHGIPSPSIRRKSAEKGGRVPSGVGL
jgi:hypothetical protein